MDDNELTQRARARGRRALERRDTALAREAEAEHEAGERHAEHAREHDV